MRALTPSSLLSRAREPAKAKEPIKAFILPTHNPVKQQPKDTRAPCLSNLFFSNLIKLETDFSNKAYTVETLDELMECYGEAVEYYDSIKDNIASYFIFKIQDALSKKKTFTLLLQENARVANEAAAAREREAAEALAQAQGQAQEGNKDLKESAEAPHSAAATTENKATIPLKTNPAPLETVDISDDDDEEEDDDEIAMLQQRRRTHQQNPLKNNNSTKRLSVMKDKNQKMFNLRMKLQNEKLAQKSNLTAVLAAFGGSSQDNDKVVLNDIAMQKSMIRNRVARKKKEKDGTAMMNFTQSSMGFLHRAADNMENMNLEGMLMQLDDEDSRSGVGNNDQNGSTNGKESVSDGVQETLKVEEVI